MRILFVAAFFTVLLPSSGAAPAVVASTAAASTPSVLESSKIRLDAQDIPGALADADRSLAKGGGADALAARGNALWASGRPMQEVVDEYGKAAKLDPRYLEKFNGLIAQRESAANPKKEKGAAGFDGVPMLFIVGIAMAGLLLIFGAVVFARRRDGKPALPGDDEVKAAGKQAPPGMEPTKP